jgi:predicted ATPase
MHIRRVSIENIRRFGSGTVAVDLQLPQRGWIVVAGRNGSGKTTLLKVLALALSSSFSHEYTDSLFSWCRKGAEKARSRLILVPSKGDVFRSEVELFSTKSADDELVVGDDWRPFAGSGMTHGRQSDGNRAFAGPWHLDPKGWFAVGYGAHRRLLGQAGTAEGWSTATTREGAFLTLFRDDASLAHPIRWLMDLDYRSLDPHVRAAEQKDARRIVERVLSMLNDDLLDDVEVLGVTSHGLSVRQDGQQLSLFNLGAGAQILTTLVVDILRHMHARFGTLQFMPHSRRTVVKHSGVVLIDEVEAHLHPAWQRRIGFWLRKHFPEVQFIVTTHSPFVCQAAVDNGLILLPEPGSTVSAHAADPSLFSRVVNGSVDDALLSGLFGLERTWSDAAEGKRDRLATVEARVLIGKAKAAEREEYKRLLSEVPQTMSDEVNRVSARLSSSPKVSTKR